MEWTVKPADVRPRCGFPGSDDFPADAKTAAAGALSEALADGWPGGEIESRFPLERVAEAREAIEGRKVAGRVIVGI